MDETDRFLLHNSGPTRLVICLPTAAGTEGQASLQRWMEMGETHFAALGAQVTSLPIGSRAEAENVDFASQIEQADLIYFSGGKPHYLYESLVNTNAWEAVQKATLRGAVLAGCSAGAMVFGAFLPDLGSFGLRKQPAFGILPNSHILPHFDRLLVWRGLTVPILQALLPEGEYVLGLDEDTALVGKPGLDWTVMGRQSVSVITKHEVFTYTTGNNLLLPGASSF
jgi:cyanophycinase